MNWNWDHLRFFLALAEKHTLTLAAKDLDVSHSTVLRRIKAFEQELETHLFDHTSSGYSLTRAGQSLYIEVRKMKNSVDTISREIAGVDQQIEGDVIITSTDTLSYHVLPQILEKLHIQYPELRITLSVMNDLTDIANREADIAIRAGSDPPAHLIGRKIGKLRFNACASAAYANDHGLTEFPQDTANYHFIELDQSYRDRPFHRWLHSRLHASSACTTVNGFLTAYALCKAGLGIAILPGYLVSDDPDFVCLVTEPEVASNDLWLLSHADMRGTARIRLVKNFLYEALIYRFL